MNFIAPRAEPLIRDIPLSRLALAPENVRKTPPDPQADAELKASIAVLGLLENLVVRTGEPDNDGTERYAVVAGGRRLKAMQALVGDGVLDADHPVLCLVKSGDVEPGEISLAENVILIAMHPADQVVAFTKLTEAGQSVSSIASRFGMSERLVEQRLRLGNAAPELLEAYRANEIDLEVLKAFAVTTDRERQMAVWEQVSAQGYRPSAWQVKRLLTEERITGRPPSPGSSGWKPTRPPAARCCATCSPGTTRAASGSRIRCCWRNSPPGSSRRPPTSWRPAGSGPSP